jgi:tetratricopeptide (TPR) repeat protein
VSPALRLALAAGTLTVFWYGLFVSTAVNDGTTDSPPLAAEVATGARTGATDAATLDALLVASREAFTAGQWQDAVAPTRALVERFPGQPIYVSRLAEIYNKLGQTANEAAAWELFMERAPLPSEACPSIGYAYRRLGKDELALGAFERCFASDTKSAELAFFVGLANEWLGRFTPAQEYYERAIAIATVHYDSEVGLARLRLHRNQLADALARVTKVLGKVPEHVDGLLVAGLAQQRAGKRREARVHLEKAATLSDDYFDVQLALGVLDYSESRFAEARKRFETAHALDARRRDEVQPWLERTAGVASGKNAS